MLIVKKFGGTSVGTVERIKAVAQRIVASGERGEQSVVVVSAMAGETDRLLGLARQIGQLEPRETDVLLASGEQVSVALLAMAIRAAGGDAVSLLAHQIRLRTDSKFSKARIRAIDDSWIKRALERGQVPVIAGFQGIDPSGNITTLGRGGGDTSAVAVAARLGAELCEIYTDVDGVYTTDPSLCPAARKIERITYEEMMELASLGAKVLQIRSVEVASAYNIPVHVRSSFTEEEGTMMLPDDPSLEKIVVTGVTLDKQQCRITLRGVPLRAGIQAALFRPLAEAGVVLDMIVQNPPIDGRAALSFTLPRSELEQARELMEPHVRTLGAEMMRADDDVAKVSIVGVGMRSHSGVAQRMFEILEAAGIEIHMISTSEIKVSCLIPRANGEDAVRALHAGFIENP